MIDRIIDICEREIHNNTLSSGLAKEVLSIIREDDECDCDHHEIPEVREEDLIRSYVEREGDCEVDEIKFLDEEDATVFRVTVKKFSDKWEVPPPEFWYVCTSNIMNLYRNDNFVPRPWVNDGQEESSVVDYIKSFHIGLCVRMSMRQEREVKNGSHH